MFQKTSIRSVSKILLSLNLIIGFFLLNHFLMLFHKSNVDMFLPLIMIGVVYPKEMLITLINKIYS